MADDRRPTPDRDAPPPARLPAPLPGRPVSGRPVPAIAVPAVRVAVTPAKPVPAIAVPAVRVAVTPAKPAPAIAVPPVAAKPAIRVPKVAVPLKPAPRPAPGRTGPDPLVGKQIGRCKILEQVGIGRTAIVYRAHHEGLGKDVAVKILLPEVLQYPEVVAKFELEARAIARLDHPNVLKIYDVVTEGEIRGIVMELLEGESVLEYLQHETRIPPADALRVVRQAAAGLQAAHAKGIIHRDVKPQNLVILEDGTVKLVDFGLATAAGDDNESKRIGTPHYMAPEACEAKPVEIASDVYSLGITLHHLLTGQPPYAGLSIKEILAAHIAAKPLQPERVVPGLGAPICDLVRALTKRDPLMRPTAEQVVERVDLIGGDDLVKQQRLAPRRSRHRRAARDQSPVALIAIGGALLVGLLIFVLSKGSPPPGAPPAAAVAPPAPEGPSTPSVIPPGSDLAPTAPVETAQQKADRLAADRKADEEGRKIRSAKALADATEFARQHADDKASVIQQYRQIARGYGETDAGKEAKRRAEGIEKGTIHPHPDRVYSPPTAVDTARAAWDASRERVEEAVVAMRYDDALHLVPNTVEDPDGKLSDELSLWRDVARDLTEFFPALVPAVDAMKPADRTMGTPKGEGLITQITTSGPVVEVGVGDRAEKTSWTWAALPPADIADLARRALAKKDDPRPAELLAAFTWAHRLKGVFYQTALALKMSAGSAGIGTQLTDRLLARADARFKK